MLGTIKILTEDQKYGTLIGEDGISRLFERPEQSLVELLSEGDEVMFLAHRSDKGPAASDVKLVPCPYCGLIIHTSAHLSVCLQRPATSPPPLQAVKKLPARVGDKLIQFQPFGSQPDRGRFFVYNLQNEEVGTFDRYDNACAFALGLTPVAEKGGGGL
jgi:cold shock CspA family protein